MFRKFAEVHYSTFEYYINKHNVEHQQRNLFKSIESNFLNILDLIYPRFYYMKPVGVFSVGNTLGKTGAQEPQVTLGFSRAVSL